MAIRKPGINSNSIPVGSVGVDDEYSSYAAAEVGLSVSRQEYQRGIRENASIKGVYQAVISYLSKLSDQDIAARLNEYGDAKYLGKSFNRATAIDQLAESMIVRLSKKDLMQIMGTVDTENKRFITNTLKDRNSKTSAFSIGSLQSYADEIGDANISKRKGRKQLREMLSRETSKYAGVEGIFNKRHGLPKLYKEVLLLYRNARPDELAETALGIGISFDDGIEEKELVSRIANKVCLYAAMILGKTKIVAAIGGEQVQNIKRILQFTTFAYVAGLQRMSPDQIMQERMAMEVARRQAKIVNRAKRRRARKEDYKTAYGDAAGDVLSKISKNGLLDKTLMGMMNKVKELTIPEANRLRSTINAIRNISIPLYEENARNNVLRITEIPAPETQLPESERKNVESQIVALKREANDIAKTRYKTEKLINLNAQPIELHIAILLQDGARLAAQQRAMDTAYTRKNNALKVFGVFSRKARQRLSEEHELSTEALKAENAVTGIDNAIEAQEFAGLSEEEQAIRRNAAAGYAVPLVTLDDNGGIKDIEKLYQAVPVAIVADSRRFIQKEEKHDETNQISLADMTDDQIDDVVSVMNAHVDNPDEAYKILRDRGYGEAADYIGSISGENDEYLNGLKESLHLVNEEPAVAVTPDPTDIAEEAKEQEHPDIVKRGVKLEWDERVGQYRQTEGIGAGQFAGKDGEINQIWDVFNDLANQSMTPREEHITKKYTKKTEEEKKNRNDEKEFDVVEDDAVFSDYAIDSYKYVYIGKKHPIQPVFITNKFTDLFQELIDMTDSSAGTQASILNYLQTSIPILFTGLQMAGMAANISAGTATGVGIKEIVTAAAGAAVEMSKIRLRTHARGAISEPGQGEVTRFVAGDSENGAPNEELVNIDWENRQYSVKPVDRVNEQRQQTQERGKSYTPLSVAERQAPLLATLSSGYVTYNKNITDVVDDGNKTALKVYSVNTGINEKIRIGDTEVSVFDIIYGIYSEIQATNVNLTTNNQLLTAIAANTANTVTAVTNSNRGGSSPDASGGFSNALDDILHGS